MSFKPGDEIGDFTIVRKLRKGGMATLYLAERTGAAGFSKHVAIKVVHPHLSEDPYFVKMFLDEARLSARIQHPNCVHVEQLDDLNGSYYLVMEFVHGCALSSFLRGLHKRGRRLTPELAVHIGLAIADGLHAAHETRGPSGNLLGVVHRDVSPDNVLLAYEGHVKLIDFGIAKAQGRAAETVAQQIKGKFRYMSPEHARGEQVDRRTDIYSLGIVLWEMLAARRLFDAPNQWILLQTVRDPKVDPPSTYSQQIPAALDEVVLAALARDPDDRPQTALELRRRLAEAFPSSFSVSSADLAELVRYVMSDRIEADQKLLPEEISRATGNLPDKTITLEDEDIVRTLTESDGSVASNVTPSGDDEPPVEEIAEAPATALRAHYVRARLAAHRLTERLSQRLPPALRDQPRVPVVAGLVTGAIAMGVVVGLAGGGSLDLPPKAPKSVEVDSAPTTVVAEPMEPGSAAELEDDAVPARPVRAAQPRGATGDAEGGDAQPREPARTQEPVEVAEGAADEAGAEGQAPGGHATEESAEASSRRATTRPRDTRSTARGRRGAVFVDDVF